MKPKFDATYRSGMIKVRNTILPHFDLTVVRLLVYLFPKWIFSEYYCPDKV